MDLSLAAVEFRTGFLSRLLRRANIKALHLGPHGVSCLGVDGTAACEPFGYEHLAPAEIRRGRLWGTIVLADASGRRFHAAGLRNRVADRAGTALAARVILHASRDHLASLVAWAGSHAELVSGTRFISRWEHDRWIETWADSADWERLHRQELGEGLPLLASGPTTTPQ